MDRHAAQERLAMTTVIQRGRSRRFSLKQYKAWKKPGRPPVEVCKAQIGFRLAADVVAGVRSTEKGYNARVEKVLREALAKGEL